MPSEVLFAVLLWGALGLAIGLVGIIMMYRDRRKWYLHLLEQVMLVESQLENDIQGIGNEALAQTAAGRRLLAQFNAETQFEQQAKQGETQITKKPAISDTLLPSDSRTRTERLQNLLTIIFIVTILVSGTLAILFAVIRPPNILNPLTILILVLTALVWLFGNNRHKESPPVVMTQPMTLGSSGVAGLLLIIVAIIVIGLLANQGG